MAVAALVLAAAIATPAVDPAGLWALRAQDRTLMLFDVRHDAKGWSATWTQPGDYLTDGAFFDDLAAGTTSRRAREVRPSADGVELVFDAPKPDWQPDRFTIHTAGGSSATMTWAAFATVPYRLERVSARTVVGPWQANRSYVADTDRPTDAEMTALFDADQGDRADPAHLDWSAVLPRDRVRLKRTQALIDGGALSSGDDFYHAAYVFQHGEKPDDFLKAHALAMVAMARGRTDAIWIATATLDRYLQRIGQPQVYGTQFTRPGDRFTQEPYNRELLPDAVRVASHVPPLAAQAKQTADWDRMMPLAKSR